MIAEETGTSTVKGFPTPVRTYRVVGLDDDSIQGRVIRQEQDGLLLIIDKRKFTAEGRVLQEAVGRLKD